MELLNNIKTDTIIICSSSNKRIILNELNNYDKLVPLKFLTLNELYKMLFFDYDEKSLYYLINKYNIKYDVAKVYLDNLIYVNEHTDSKRINNLIDIKEYLDSNNLLIKDEYFKEFIYAKDIIFYGFDYIDKFMKKVIDILKKTNNVSVIEKKYKNKYNHDVLEFNHIEDEVEYVATSISELVDKGISLNNIKLTNINEEYYNSIRRIFKMYNLNVELDDECFISDTIIGSKFIKNYESDLNNTISKLNKEDECIINQIINIINKYSFISDKLEVKEMIIHDLNNIRVSKNRYSNLIKIIDYNDIISDNEYVFMLNFNQGMIPKIIKNESYLSDKDKELLGLDTSVELSKMMKDATINNINSIKNLVITYKLESYNNKYFPSSLITDMNLEVKKVNNNMSYSNLANKVRLCKELDKYYKYNIRSNDLSRLYSSYSLSYRSYNNNFNGITIESLNKIMNKLVLSYSSMQAYNECAFKYYINNVLKLDFYEDTFSAFLGSLFHYVLEKGINNDIDVNEEINKFINNRELNAKELFFIEKITKDIVLVLKTIKDNLRYTKLTNITTENKFEVIKDDVVFKGFVDKLMTYQDNNNTYVAIVDYKTYDTDINLDLIDYGLNLQLPIYLYLVNNNLENAIFTGFYVQRVLSKEIKYDDTTTLEEQKIDSMKLLGYSNSDTNILGLFDNNYEDSKVIKDMKLKNDGSFYSTAKVLSNEKMQELINKTDTSIEKCINNIKNAKFDINPKNYKDNNISCKYCKYKDICFKKYEDEVILKVGEEDA